MADGGEGAGESITVHHLVEQIRIGSTVANEVNTVRAMQRLFSMCRSKTPGHIANQAAAADADAVTALLDLVNSGSIRQRTWAFNTLGRLCFDHAENAAKVCTSPAMEKAVDNMMSMSMSTVGVADERAPGVVGTQATPGLIMWRQPEPVLQPGRLAQLKSDPARVKDKSAYLLGNLAARPASHPRLLACGAANAAVAVLTALNYAREKAKDQNDPAPLPIHDAFIARCVGLLTNLSVHEPSRAAVLQAGAILPLIQVAQSGCARHRPASAAIASANLCKRGSGTRFDRQSVPDLDAFPTDVLGNVVEALSSAVKREKYMGNVYYTPWKVAMGVSNLAALCSENRCALIQHGVVRHLVVGLDFDERSQHHCTSALYEICVGYPKMEAEVLMKESETVTAATHHCTLVFRTFEISIKGRIRRPGFRQMPHLARAGA